MAFNLLKLVDALKPTELAFEVLERDGKKIP